MLPSTVLDRLMDQRVRPGTHSSSWEKLGSPQHRDTRHTSHLKRQERGHSSVRRTVTGQTGGFAGLHSVTVRGMKGHRNHSHLCPPLSPMGEDPSSGARQSGAKKKKRLGWGGPEVLLKSLTPSQENRLPVSLQAA